MKDTDFLLFIKEIDHLIRSGKSSLAIKLLNGLKGQKIPREHISEIAVLARRTRQLRFALQLLNPIIRSETIIYPKPTMKEKIDYASILVLFGALEEGLSLLSEGNPKDYPEVLLYTSFAHIKRWDYHLAIPFLNKYCVHPDLTDYQRNLGLVNLAAAYNFKLKFKKSRELLQQLEDSKDFKDNNLIRSNLHELRAQTYIWQGNYDLAKIQLHKGKNLLAGSNNIFEFFIDKWLCACQLLENPKSKQHHSELEKFRDKSMMLAQWETLRECDFLLGVAQNDKSLLDKVYWGTPYKPYRRHLLSMKNVNYLPTKRYLWYLQKDELVKEPSLNVSSQEDLGKFNLKAGSQIFNLLELLSQDFYRPLRLVEIHSQLFPGEYYNPHVSPNRVSQAIYRFKQWSVNQNLPLQIKCVNGEYKLVSERPFSIGLGEKKLTNLNFVRLSQLKKIWPYKSFSPQAASKQLLVSISTTHRLLKWAEKEGRIYASGNASDRSYRFRK